MKFRKIAALFMAAAVMTCALPATYAFAEEEEEEVVDGEEEGEEETAEIKVALMCFAPMDSTITDPVEEALNEMLLEKINVQADFTWYDAATYGTQVPMAIQSGEQLDLIMFTPVPGASYQSYMNQNQLLPITEYVEEYGDNIKAALGDYLEATTKDGEIYGVGNLMSLYGGEGIVMRKDILDELGLTEKAQNMTTFTEYQEILTAVVEAHPELKGITNSDAEGSTLTPQPFRNPGDSFEEAEWVDTLGDSFQYVYGDPETNEVKCYFDESWLASVKRVKEMYDAGLIYKDAATAQDYADTLIKNGVGFSEVKTVESGAEAAAAASCGHEMIINRVVKTKVATGAFQKFGFAVPVTAEEPEAAVKLINLLNGDSDVQNTITWGVEGVHWVRTEANTAAYPEGVTAETVGYHTGDFLYGNTMTVLPWDGEGSDTIRERQMAENEEVEKSPFLGFAVDSEPVSTTIAACKNVIDQYKPMLSSGAVEDVDAAYAEFMEALTAAGMDEVVAEYQSQLDAWLAAK